MKKQTKKIINTDPKALLAAGLIGLKTLVPIGAAAALFSGCPNGTTVPTPVETFYKNFNGVDFYRVDLTQPEAQPIFDGVEGMFAGWSPTKQSRFSDGRVTKIYVKPGNTVSKIGTILNIGVNAVYFGLKDPAVRWMRSSGSER